MQLRCHWLAFFSCLQPNIHRFGDIVSLLHDALGIGRVNSTSPLDGVEDETNLQPDSKQTRVENTMGDNEFLELLKDMNEELYPRCKAFSELSFILHLYHLKCLNGRTGKSFSMLLKLLLDAFPDVFHCLNHIMKPKRPSWH